MTTTDQLGIPVPPSPVKESFGLEGQYEFGNTYTDEITHNGGVISVSVTDDRGSINVKANSEDFTLGETLWTAVYWAREFGVPGVCKETIMVYTVDEMLGRLRLGGLYQYAGFDLTERESNYSRYGENPYKP